MKKSISIVQSSVVMALVILLAVLTFLPVITINTDSDADFMKEYEEGYFTKDADVPKTIDIGVGQIISAIPNMSEITDVITTQFAYAYMESGIESISNEITKISLEEGRSWEEKQERIEDLREDIEELRANFNAKIGKLGEDRIAILNTMLLEDEDFRSQVATLYSVIGLLKWDHEAISSSSTIPEGTYPDDFPLVETITVAISVIVLILFAIITAITFTVKAIIRLTKFIIAMTKSDFRTTEKLSTDLTFSMFVAPMLLCLAIAKYFVGDAISMGSAIIPFIVTALVIGLMRIIDFVIFECKSNMAIINTVTKKALTLTVLILAIVFIFNFAGLGIYGEMMETYEGYHDIRSDELLEEYSEDMKLEEAQDKANEDVESAGRLVYAYLPLLGIVFAAVVASVATDRFCVCVLDSKKSKKKEVESQFVVAILTVAIAALPVYFAANSITEMENCHEDGEFAVFYDEYLYEGTEEYEEYQTLKANIATAKTELENNRDQLSTEEIVNANQLIKSGEEMLASLETTEESDVSACLTLAIFIAILEVAYFISAKILGKLSENAPERVAKPKKKAVKKPEAKKTEKVEKITEKAEILEEEIIEEDVEESEEIESEDENEIPALEEEELPEEEVIAADEAPVEEAIESVEEAVEATEEAVEATEESAEATVEEGTESEAVAEEATAEEATPATEDIEEADEKEKTSEEENIQ